MRVYTGHPRPTTRMTYRDIRDAKGHLIARYDARRDLLAIKSRGQLTTVDLRSLREAEEKREEKPKTEDR